MRGTILNVSFIKSVDEVAMAVHDWTLVEPGVFHAFHLAWVGGIQNALNQGVLPEGYYALAEQHAGRFIPDVLTLHASPAEPEPMPPLPPATGGLLLADAPPKVQRKQVIEPVELARRRSLAIRHVSGHRLVALLEILSPANKDRSESVTELAGKVVAALDHGVHVLLVDLFPPGRHDPRGMHDAVLRQHWPDMEPYDLPIQAPLTLASYKAGPRVEIFLNHFAVGDGLAAMPLFFHPDRYVETPLAPTYQAAYQGMPAFWREVLEKGWAAS